MKKSIVLLLFMVSSSLYAIDVGDYAYLVEKKKVMMLLLHEHKEDNLSILPQDVRKYIASYILDLTGKKSSDFLNID